MAIPKTNRDVTVLLALWRDLTVLACGFALFATAITVLTSIDGWLCQQTPWEVAQGVGERILLAIAAGCGCGTLAVIPAWVTGPLTSERAASARKSAFALIIVFAAILCLQTWVKWLEAVASPWLRLLPETLLTAAVSVYHLLFIRHPVLSGAVVLSCCGVTTLSPAIRRILLRDPGPVLGPTRRVVVTAGLAGALLAATRAAGAIRAMPAGSPLGPAMPGARNILLVTFDAMTAEDLSCYGYGLPTSPNLDALARASHVFEHFYSGSTFTSPSLATVLTGRYPSSTRLYHLAERLRGPARDMTIAAELRRAGYHVAATVANGAATPEAFGIGADFREISPLPFLAQFCLPGTNCDPSHPANLVAIEHNDQIVAVERLADPNFVQFPPTLSFSQAEALLAELPSPFFLWVHVFAPHEPFTPAPPYLNRFQQGSAMTGDIVHEVCDLPGGHYTPGRQPLADIARRRYDEWLAQADGAFGDFLGKLERTGRLRDTVLAVSADHGQSFEGGRLGHGGAEQLRPIIHVPLMIHLPGQTSGQRISRVADHASLAPTLLDLAGVTPPAWMDGKTLRPWLTPEGGGRAAGDLAFTQYLERNSAFRPIRNGTVGVIDGEWQYVIDLASGVGKLFRLDEAHLQAHDRAATHPDQAARLRDAIFSQFPELPRQPA